MVRNAWFVDRVFLKMCAIMIIFMIRVNIQVVRVHLQMFNLDITTLSCVCIFIDSFSSNVFNFFIAIYSL